MYKKTDYYCINMQYKYTIIFITIFIPNHPNHNYMKNGFTHIPPTHTCRGNTEIYS